MPEQQTLQTAPESGPAAHAPLEPVRRSIRVRADAARAFRVFTEGMDGWWPRTHHIGSSPMKRVVVEGRVGGAIYTDQEDGTTCPWGSVLAWEPPHRFVMAWQVSPEWKYEPNRAKCSEVDVRFTPADDGTTLVELEHRGLERHGAGCDTMREQVSREGGWGGLLEMFAATVGGRA
ncbi:MAG: SRPBCC family protein [Acidobacteriota bacterium]|nr:SRPBCC family protein [Acidobacteriota bacterium]